MIFYWLYKVLPYRSPRRIDCKEGGQCLALAVSFAQSADGTDWILSKIFLASLHDLLNLLIFTWLTWACGWVFHPVLEL